MNQYILEATHLAEKRPWANLVGTRWNMSYQCVLAAQKPSGVLRFIRSVASSPGGLILPLHSQC